MTPGETTSERKRSRSYWGFGLIGAVVLVAAQIFWAGTSARPPVSLTVLRYHTKDFPEDYYAHAHTGISPSFTALVSVSNTTGRDVAYWSTTAVSIYDLEGRIKYGFLRITNSWWKAPKPDRFHTVPSKRSNQHLAEDAGVA